MKKKNGDRNEVWARREAANARTKLQLPELVESFAPPQNLRATIGEPPLIEDTEEVAGVIFPQPQDANDWRDANEDNYKRTVRVSFYRHRMIEEMLRKVFFAGENKWGIGEIQMLYANIRTPQSVWFLRLHMHTISMYITGRANRILKAHSCFLLSLNLENPMKWLLMTQEFITHVRTEIQSHQPQTADEAMRILAAKENFSQTAIMLALRQFDWLITQRGHLQTPAAIRQYVDYVSNLLATYTVFTARDFPYVHAFGMSHQQPYENAIQLTKCVLDILDYFLLESRFQEYASTTGDAGGIAAQKKIIADYIAMLESLFCILNFLTCNVRVQAGPSGQANYDPIVSILCTRCKTMFHHLAVSFGSEGVEGHRASCDKEADYVAQNRTLVPLSANNIQQNHAMTCMHKGIDFSRKRRSASTADNGQW